MVALKKLTSLENKQKQSLFQNRIIYMQENHRETQLTILTRLNRRNSGHKYTKRNMHSCTIKIQSNRGGRVGQGGGRGAGKGQGTIGEGAGRRNQGGEDRGRRTEQEKNRGGVARRRPRAQPE